MSGWDVSSTPTWGSQDGPEESQSQSSPPAGFPESPAGPPPEFFSGEYGQQEQHDVTPGGYPKRTPGRSLQDLPRRDARGRHSSQPGSYGQDDAFSQDSPFSQNGAFGGQNGSFGGQNGAFGGGDSGYGQNGAFGQESPFGQDNGRAQDSAYSQDGGHDTGYGQENAYGQDNAYGRDAAFGQDSAYNQDSTYGIGWGGQSQPAPADQDAAPWEERPQQGPFYPDLDSSAPAGQDYQRQAPARPVTEDWGHQDYQAADAARGGQDYPGQDYASPDYPGQGYAGQGDRDQPPPGFERRAGEQGARMDPALQDFFAPQAGSGNGYQDPWGDSPGGSGNGRDGARYPQGDDGWAEPARSQPPRGGTGPRPAAGRGFDDERRGGLGTRSYIVIGAVVAVIIVVAVLALSRGGSGGTPGSASGNPTTNTTTSASSAPSAKASAATSGAGTAAAPSGGTAAAAYVLSAPSKAGGFPKGSDPHFLSIATSTAAEVSSAVTEGKAGAVKGSPISAAYQLPVGGQVVTFVGYQGTFTPAKVATVLASLGTDAHSYPAGSHGGVLGCANTKPTATVTSGAVCVWASSSTIGVTEFFSSTGPESLTSSQNKGATDTVNIRGDVEAKSS